MLDTSARLLQFLSLLQSRRFWSGQELAVELDVSERTVRRDVDRLRTLGYPVEASVGVAGGYSLGAGKQLPPLLLDGGEAAAVAFGLRSALLGTVAGMEQAALRALVKLEQVLPAQARAQMARVHAAVVFMPSDGPTVDAEVLARAAGACRDQQTLRFAYTDRQGQTRERFVEPYGLVPLWMRWYLVAFDRDRDAFRTFRLDRITGPVTFAERFAPRPLPDADLGAYVTRSVGMDAHPHRARVRFLRPHDEVAQRIPASVGQLTPDGDGCTFESGTADLRRLALHLVMVDIPFRVLEPPELREQLRRLSEQLARALETA